ncbi:hypothetical protein COB64_03615 [Candidatus Wolfebacteria bacterium]|nr:MAG: hypothetical protein COB64_03615 [Candidatus Wolfebacteria bacterium]
MYLKRIELSGFKSFAKKTTLEFTSPITAIVGPNGSGKSNIVEAIRFVLGEQSIKSLRGKSGSDLIFKGSKNLSKLSRASVSAIFDNRKKIFKLELSDNKSLNLDFEEVIISREVFSDGGNKYLLNKTDVRLKDIHELLSGVNIGSSGHHIISQGEADRILSASIKERRDMIEDALGLKIFKYRLRESERKLERSNENLKEVALLRREIAPHIKFLKRQVEKIQKAEEMRKELGTLYREYLKREEFYIKSEGENLGTQKNRFQIELDAITQSLGEDNSLVGEEDSTTEKSQNQIAIDTKEQELSSIRDLKDELSRKLGRIEGMIEVAEEGLAGIDTTESTQMTVPYQEVEDFAQTIKEYSDTILTTGNESGIETIIRSIQDHITTFLSAYRDVSKKETSFGDATSKLEEMKASKESISGELQKIEDKENNLTTQVIAFKKLLEQEKVEEKEKNRVHYELLMKKRDIESEMNLIRIKEENFKRIKNAFQSELTEGEVLIGQHIFAYTSYELEEDQVNESRAAQEERRKKIERLKIKLEDAGASTGNDVLKEYDEVTERDHFLKGEIEDLNKSIESLQQLMNDLQDKLDTQFKEGINKINAEFDTFFRLMFGGGNASIKVITEQKRKRKKNEDLESVSEEMEDEVEEFEGVEIDVSLPRKKTRELHMLSGGERSLASIALLFAISRVNPPPFLVLDETDAALDEANSRKYGDMLERLSKSSQLIVVTHNRETMSRANVLYGVTVGLDGGSKLLSVHFDEAVQIAK